MTLPSNAPIAADSTLSKLRSLVARGRHAEAERLAQASGRRVSCEAKRTFLALRAEIALGLGKFTAALGWASDALKGLGADTPVRVEYELTKKGRALHDAVDAIAAWAEAWLPASDVKASPAPSAAKSRRRRSA